MTAITGYLHALRRGRRLLGTLRSKGLCRWTGRHRGVHLGQPEVRATADFSSYQSVAAEFQPGIFLRVDRSDGHAALADLQRALGTRTRPRQGRDDPPRDSCDWPAGALRARDRNIVPHPARTDERRPGFSYHSANAEISIRRLPPRDRAITRRASPTSNALATPGSPRPRDVPNRNRDPPTVALGCAAGVAVDARSNSHIFQRPNFGYTDSQP